jgi:uncharacterized membrane protein
MTKTIDNYVSQPTMTAMRRQAWKVWTVGVLVVFVWVFSIVLAPLAKANGVTPLSSALFHFFGYICHQIPERSFHLAGEQFGVCSRCFGVYFGLFLGFAVYPFWRNIVDIEPLPRFWLFLSLVPIAVDWSLTVFGIWENTQFSRLITGLILGFACATFMVPALVEIFRNLTFRRRAS